MGSTVENLQNFGDLEDHTKLRYLIMGSGVMVIFVGIVLFVLIDDPLIALLAIAAGILDITVVSKFIANQSKRANEDA